MLKYPTKKEGFGLNELIEENKVENMIYEVRGRQVMLDSDLAQLYQVETKRINEAVKNNPDKFPERFSWKLTEEESDNFLVENFDQKIERRGGRFKNPRVFTEQGIAMLATLLKPLDIEKYNQQYKNLQVFYSNTFHDRHFILDRNIVYHCGSSLNHAGNKTFSINILEDELLKESLIANIKTLFT